ncbi:MAG: hypothetical protein Q7K55_02120 [Candidatus Levybacteria bacterium]|nr:hypothetical protein [Candidatus Levybacteria bacterium]
MISSILKTAYKDLIVDHEKDMHFWMLVTFLPTFIILRLIVYFVVFGSPSFFIEIYDIHVHHMTFGIISLAVIGYLSLTASSRQFKIRLSAFFGIGLAFTFDEFGMWLNLKDDYWIRQSYDAVLIIILWFINTVYFYNFWKHILRNILRIRPVKLNHTPNS